MPILQPRQLPVPYIITPVLERELSPIPPHKSEEHRTASDSKYEVCQLSHRQLRRLEKESHKLLLLMVRPDKRHDLLAKELNIHTHRLNSTELIYDQSDMQQLRNEFKDVFPDNLPKGLPPKRAMDCQINLEPGSKPPFKNYYRMSPKDLEEVKEHITEMLDLGFIRESHSLMDHQYCLP